MHLKTSLAVLAVCSTLAAPAGVGARTTAGLDLAQSKACMACHQVDSKRVGPPLRSVAERYAGHGEAVQYLANKIRQGGRGAWGAVPMPAQQVSEAEARELAEWVLTLAPAEP